MKYRALFYSTAVALPLAALAFTGVHAATTDTTIGTNEAPKWGIIDQATLTDAQKAAIEQAKALHEQAHALNEQARDILEKAGLPARHPGKKMMRAQLTDDQKAILEQVKTLREQGKNDEAKALLEKSGIPFKGPMHMGRGMGRRPAGEVK